MTRQIRLRKGLNVPIAGEPEQRITDGPSLSRVAVLGADFHGMKPTMAVAEGDLVATGQFLFTDKKHPEVAFTAPGAGRVVSIRRGLKRRFEGLVIELEGDAKIDFPEQADRNLAALPREEVRDQLLKSGMWTALRARPFDKIPDPATSPYALFVTAIDTNPLAADPRLVISGAERDFKSGLEAISTLTDGRTYVCRGPGGSLPGEDTKGIEVVEFSGPHPAGLPGTHIHFLAPVDFDRVAWHIGYQDVIAIGHLFNTGQLMTDRVVALAGPAAAKPRLIKTRLGANLAELTTGEIRGDLVEEVRVISGSVLSGRKAEAPLDHLGRYHNAVALVEEGHRREFLGWAGPGFKKFSVKPIFMSAFFPQRQYAMTTSTEGSPRAIVPIGSFEKVMPLDIVVTALAKAITMQDHEQAQSLGCLELAEEDMALCTFVDPGKHEFGPLLRQTLAYLEAEG